MEFALSEETQMLREQIRRFVEEELEPAIDDIEEDIEGYHEFDTEHAYETDNIRPQPINLPKDVEERLRDKARELGFWALGVPEEYGGAGLSLVERVVVQEELSKHKMGLYHPGLDVIELAPGLTVGQPASYLDKATDDQIAEYFQPCIEGEKHSCFGLTEPAAGSDPRGMETRAERNSEEWVINGEKHFITYADEADFVILFARTRPKTDDVNDHGITAFLVPKEADGFSLGRSIQVIRPEHPFELHFDDVVVPDENVLGEVGEGLDIAKECLGEQRILYASHSLGPMDQAIRMAKEWANDRVVGGEPLANKQAIQWKVAESVIDYHTVKFMVYRAAWEFDQGYDVRHVGSMAKYVATERLWDVLDRCVQVHGGMGVTADLPLERWLRESRVRRIGEGPSEIHLKTIARNILKEYEDPDPVPL